jgi:hypothetical protein
MGAISDETVSFDRLKIVKRQNSIRMMKMMTLKMLIMVMVTAVMITVFFVLSLGSFAWTGPQYPFKSGKANPYNPDQ